MVGEEAGVVAWPREARAWHVELGERRAGAGTAADELEGLVDDVVEGALGGEMGVDLGLGEDGLEEGDEVGGADDLFAERAEELDGAGVDHGDIHDGVVGGVLHGDAGEGSEHGVETTLELLPGGVDAFGAGEVVELAGFDAMDELAGLAFGGDDVVPAAADEAGSGKAEDGGSNGIAVVMVVKEPGVEAGGAKGRLDGFKMHKDRV